jgi:hypothetical protein
MHAARLARRAVTLAAATFVLTACEIDLDAQRVTAHEEKRFIVQGRPELTLVTFDGSIEVTGWDQPEVVIDIRKQGPSAQALEEIEVRVAQDGDRISVEVVEPKGSRGLSFGPGRSVSLVVSVPRQAVLTARSGDGAVTIERVEGRVDVNTGDGSVRGAGLSGELKMRTGDGSVTLDDVKGQVEIQTGDGSISVNGALSRLQARTGDGAVTVRAAVGSTTAGEWDITTGDGSITLEVPPGFNATLDARTGDGRVSADGVGLTVTEQGENRRALKGQLGSGGGLVRLRSGDGSIRIGQS